MNQFGNIPLETLKMRVFPFTLRDRAREWFSKLALEFNSWGEMESEFLKKFYSVGKTNAQRRAIREFSQSMNDTFYDAWERMKGYTRQCPHHGVPDYELVQIFYEGLGDNDRYLLDAASGGNFLMKYADDALELIETVAENSYYRMNLAHGKRLAPSRKGGGMDTRAVE